MDADLTVVIPLFNQEKYIRQCIESVCNQKIPGLQIVVVNDGSTDGSLEICDEIAAIDDRVRVISQDNRGLAGARITGIKAARTRYVTFVDADDFILDNAYDDAMQFVSDGYDQIFYEISRYHNDGSVKRERHIIEEGIYDKKRIMNEIYPKMIWDFERNTPGVECSQCIRIVRRDLLLDTYERLQGRSFYYGEDIVITYPMLLHINKMVVISKSYYMHRQRDNNIAPAYISSENYFDEISQMYAYLRKAMKKDEQYDFTKHIDYMYMYSTCLKKWSYNDYDYSRDFLFPFDKVQKGEKVILYGAGLVGNTYHKQLKKLDYCQDILWVDRNADGLNNHDVMSLSELDKDIYHLFDKVVIAVENKKMGNEIKEFLMNKGYHETKIVI